jgi:hypothetical protein
MNLVLPRWLIKEYKDLLRPYVALGLRVLPLSLPLASLSQTALEALLGGGDTQYVGRLLAVAQELGDQLTIEDWRAVIGGCSGLNETTRAAALLRLKLLGQIAARPGAPGVWDMVEPGVVTVFHLSGKRIGQKDVLPLCLGLMATLSEPSPRHGPMQRLFLLDEVNRFPRQSPLWLLLAQVARQIRHQGSMLVMLGQDFLGVPDELLALATTFVTFKLRSARLLQHLRERVEGYRGVRIKDLSLLPAGEGLLVTTESTDPTLPRSARRVSFRPLCCAHGGHTRAVL